MVVPDGEIHFVFWIVRTMHFYLGTLLATEMEAIVAAIASDITNRSISYVIRKYSEMTGPKEDDLRLKDLQRLLDRVQVIVNEAEARVITNRAMVHLLNIMRKEMYRGYFTMDSLRSQANNKAKDHDVSHSFAPSHYKPAKRRHFSNDGVNWNKELQQVIHNLSNIIADAKEFLVFLENYPPLYRQPYDMHLFIGKCMFGRQMEVERIMDFLMQTAHPSMRSVGVLPIVGPGYVGKCTLVAHVYNDARVRNHFSQIVIINGDKISDDALASLKHGCVIKYQNNALAGENERVLAVIEFSENVDKVPWNSFYLSFLRCLASGSKIIITSNSGKIKKFGTTQALVLNFLPQEAFWYFFKVLTFGSADSKYHPKLESIAMTMAREMGGSFIAANFISALLRRNLSAQHWGRCLAAFRVNIQRNVSVFGEHPCNLLQKQKHARYQINEDKYMVSDQYHAYLSTDDVPKITMYDIVVGNVNCEGSFEILAWKSHILPYKSYTINCMIHEEQRIKRKNYIEGYC